MFWCPEHYCSINFSSDTVVCLLLPLVIVYFILRILNIARSTRIVGASTGQEWLAVKRSVGVDGLRQRCASKCGRGMGVGSGVAMLVEGGVLGSCPVRERWRGCRRVGFALEGGVEIEASAAERRAV